MSRPSEAWPIFAGISRRRGAGAEQLAGAAVAAGRGHHRRGQVADPGEAGEGLQLGAAVERVLDALAPDLGDGDAGGVEAVRLGRGGGERGGVLRGAGHLDPGDVARSARRRGRRGRRPRRAGPRRSASAEPSTSAAEPETASRAWAGPPRQAIAARAHPFADVLGRQLALRRDQALGQQQDRGAAADPVGDRPDRLRQRLRGDRQADQVEAGELDLRGRAHVDRLRQRHPRQVAPVLPRLDQLRRPARRVRAPSWTSRPPRASRTATAVPQLPAPITAARRIGGSPPRSSHCSCDVGPDPRGDRFRQRRRGLLGAREGHRPARAGP